MARRELPETWWIIAENGVFVEFTVGFGIALYKEYIRCAPDLEARSVNGVVSPTPTPGVKVQKRDRHLKDWIQSTPTVLKWTTKVAHRSKTTAEVYASYVYQYWAD